MSRDFVQDAYRVKVIKAICDKLNQIQGASQVIKQKILELNSTRTEVSDGVASGQFEASDLAKLDALAPGVTALLAAINAYLTQAPPVPNVNG